MAFCLCLGMACSNTNANSTEAEVTGGFSGETRGNGCIRGIIKKCEGVHGQEVRREWHVPEGDGGWPEIVESLTNGVKRGC